MTTKTMAFMRQLSKRLGRLLGIAVVITASIVLYLRFNQGSAWIGLPGEQVSMKPNTALGFLLCGSLLLMRSQGGGVFLLGLRWLFELSLLLLGALTLAQYAFHLDLMVDQLLIRAPLSEVLTSAPGRMAPTTAVSFVLAALAFISDHWVSEYHGRHESEPARIISLVCALLLLLIAFASIVGYAYRVPTLYLGIEGVTAMALSTALLFAAVALGLVWLHPKRGFPILLFENSITGKLVRALVPLVLIVPLAVGGAVIMGYGRWYKGELAVALVSIGSVAGTMLVAGLSLAVLRRAESVLFLRERALAATTSGVMITDHLAEDEPVVFVNDAVTRITGFEPEDIIGRNCRFLNQGIDNDPASLELVRDSIRNGTSCVVDLLNRCENGDYFWNRLSLAPIKSAEGIVTHFIGIIDDVSDYKKQEHELRLALKDAEAANNLRDTFVRLISHELRTPLNAAVTWMNLMELDTSAETHEKGMSIIDQSIRSQSRLIDDLVDVTRFTSVGARLELGSMDLQQTVLDIVDEMRPAIEKEHKLQLDIENIDYSAFLDDMRVQQMLRNLIANAIKYTPTGGCITVRLSQKDNGFCLAVKDTGKGLRPSEIENIFQPFWRVDHSLKGVGLGLYIVKALVKAHGGEITVTSDGLNMGSQFSVWLPREVTGSRRIRMSEDLGHINNP